jgi:hypothetical protein
MAKGTNSLSPDGDRLVTRVMGAFGALASHSLRFHLAAGRLLSGVSLGAFALISLLASLSQVMVILLLLGLMAHFTLLRR